jgi:pyruvate formate-lyase activating enzyme-like uncharacterized protein
LKYQTTNEELTGLLKEAIQSVHYCRARLKILQDHKWRLMRRLANRTRNWETTIKKSTLKISS